MASLHPYREMAQVKGRASELGGLKHHLTGQFDTVFQRPQHTSLSGHIDKLDPLAALSDLFRDAGRPQLRISGPRLILCTMTEAKLGFRPRPIRVRAMVSRSRLVRPLPESGVKIVRVHSTRSHILAARNP